MVDAMTSFHITQAEPFSTDSFLLSLMAVLKHAGCTCDYVELAGMSGIAFLIGSPIDEPCSVCRHTGLVSQLQFIGQAIGLQWHQIWPDAWAVLGESATLMPGWTRAAVEQARKTLLAGVPILVCDGWSSDCTWGCLTRWDDTQQCFMGRNPQSYNEQPVLGTPNLALYIEELVEPAYTHELAVRKSLQRAANASARFAADETAQSRTFYDVWLDRLLTAEYAPVCQKSRWECHLHLATHIRNARLAALQYLQRASELLPAQALLPLDELEFCYQQITRTLIRDTDRNYVRRAFDTVEELMEIADRISLTKRYERQASKALSRLAVYLD